MIFAKMAAGALTGAIFFFSISGWGRNGSAWFRARRSAGWWGLITAEILIVTIGYRGGGQLDSGTRLFADLMFGFGAWLMLGLPISIIGGLATYIFARATAGNAAKRHISDSSSSV